MHGTVIPFASHGSHPQPDLAKGNVGGVGENYYYLGR
jgi:hypothetical protein